MKVKNSVLFLLLFLTCFHLTSSAQSIALYPTHWWAGMKWNKVQLLVNKPMIGKETITMKPYAGVQMRKITKAESNNYVFIDLEISAAAKPGNLHFVIGNKPGSHFDFELKQRN